MAPTIEDPNMGLRDPNPTHNTHLRYSFSFPCLGSRRPTTAGAGWWQRIREAETQNRWWSKGIAAIRKVREWSEIVAGPRWKTFLRRFNRSRIGGHGSSGGRNGKFQYDPLSYALNFDEGQNGHFDEDDEQDRFRNFSTRFASVSGPLKSPESPVLL